MLTNLLASGDFASAERMTGGHRLSAADLERAVSEYVRTLVPLPPEALDELDVVAVQGAELPTFNGDIDLWTSEQGRSDLTLQLELVDRYGGAYKVSILDLHVYSEMGEGINDSVGRSIETGAPVAPIHTYGPGEPIPNFTLRTPDNLTIYSGSSTVGQSTPLSDLLQPGMGNVHWAACTKLV